MLLYITIVITDDRVPTITCPDSFIYKLSSKESTSIPYTGHEATATSGGTVTYEPKTLDVTGSDIGSHHVVTATATYKDDNNASCKFMVVIEGRYHTRSNFLVIQLNYITIL